MLFAGLGWAGESSGSDAVPAPLIWNQLPSLPVSEGFGGPFGGVSNGTLLVAGGANFPTTRPWDGGKKVWYDTVFALESPAGAWQAVGRLPRPLAYGASITTRNGIACLGGGDAKQHYAECFLLRLNDLACSVSALPSLPMPCANFAAVLLDDKIYVAGGMERPDATMALKNFWSLDLANPSAGWSELKPWPGPGRFLSSIGTQGDSIYLCSGASLSTGDDGKPQRSWLQDAYSFSPARGWRRIADLPRPAVAAPSPMPRLGQSHLLVLGGDVGTQLSAAPSEHTGFTRTVLAYHTVTNTWVARGELPFSQVTTPAVMWNGKIVVPSGETRPGARTAAVWEADIVGKRAQFSWLNIATLLAYPLCMLSIAWISATRNKNTSDYFKASGRIPWWAAGISIYATMLSSITFIAVPAKAFSTDWAYSLGYLTLVLLAPVIISFYLPFFRRLNLTSIYEYLELRFNLFIRLFGAASFIAFQIGRTGIVLFLPALALSTVSDINLDWCIVGMTLLTIAVTVYGGMEAVIWTDVAQTVILFGAIAASLIVLMLRIDGGFTAIVDIAQAEGKFFAEIPWSAELTVATGWVVVVGMGFNNLISYTSNQEVVQRYLTTPDERAAGRAVWTNAIFSLLSGLLFFGVGTALFVFYRQYPQLLDPTIQNDAIFPLFMLQELPVGVAGLVVAGIFAAAQPTSGLNSTAAVVVTDVYRRLRRNTSDHEALVVGRLATVATGLLGMSVALIASRLDIRSIWDLFLDILGLTSGVLAGLFTLGMLTRRANSFGATLGLIIGLATVLVARGFSTLHPLLYGAIGVLCTFIAGYLCSLPMGYRAADAPGVVPIYRRVNEQKAM
jgi:solute:Na+ symporter, SSS family